LCQHPRQNQTRRGDTLGGCGERQGLACAGWWFPAQTSIYWLFEFSLAAYLICVFDESAYPRPQLIRNEEMSKTVNVAMIGLGFGAEFIPIYQNHPHTNVVAICRRNEAELNKTGDQFGIEKRLTDYDQVLADPEVDYVHINSPINDHAWMSLKALDAGKHVMCTVPMATTVDECRQIVEKVQQTGLKYMMAETVVYSREFLFIKKM
jgi:hypothetical protein